MSLSSIIAIIRIMKQQSHSLSVIIPIYNSGTYLNACIDSVLAQTYSDLEVILVDDGSTGPEPEICEGYASRDSRVRVIHQVNAGSVAARETGIRVASSPYITFVDSDDYIDSDYYEHMMNSMLQTQADVVIAAYTLFDETSEEKVTQGINDGIYEGDSLKYLYHNMNCIDTIYYTAGVFPSNWTKIYRTELLKTFSDRLPRTIRMGDDAGLTFPYLLKSDKIVVDNSICGYHYRKVSGSISHTTDETLFTGSSALYIYLKQFYDEMNDPGISAQLEMYRAYLIGTAINSWMNGPLITGLSRLNKIRKLAERTTLLNNLYPVLELELTRPLRNQLSSIAQGKWLMFAFYWYRNHYACKILSRSHSSI